jgi:hypothetical protein
MWRGSKPANVGRYRQVHSAESDHYRYSITSSASTKKFGGTLRPGPLAALRLMTRSNLFGRTADQNNELASLAQALNSPG